MKKSIISLLLASVVAFNYASAAEGSGLDISASTTVAFESEYVFRGIKQYGEAIQPSVDVSTPAYEGEAYIGYWGSYSVSNTDSTAYSETDGYIGYTQSLDDMWSIDAGYTYYAFPDTTGGADRWNEIYLGFSADYMDLSPSIYGYWNFSLDAFVVEGSIGRSIDTSDFIDNTSLDLGAYAGINSADDANSDQVAGSAGDGYAYWGVSSDIVYTVNDVASASLGVRYAGNNNNSTGGLNVDPQEDLFWWGVSTSFGF